MQHSKLKFLDGEWDEEKVRNQLKFVLSYDPENREAYDSEGNLDNPKYLNPYTDDAMACLYEIGEAWIILFGHRDEFFRENISILSKRLRWCADQLEFREKQSGKRTYPTWDE